jgi:putative toxin-antitoxin system antitoxin component (TIGR02293 family)
MPLKSSRSQRTPPVARDARPTAARKPARRPSASKAAADGAKPRLAVVAGKGRTPSFERFGALSSTEREAAIKAGLPASFLDEAIARLGVSRADLLHGLGIASSTAARIKQQGKRFSLADSERLARLARLWHDANAVYETEEGTRGWMTSRVPSAGGVPLAMLDTQEGFERAQRSILQLAYGVHA